MDYEEAIKIIEQQNDELLEMFMESLMDKGLSEKTISKHCFNVDFYLNYYLVHEDYNTFDDGLVMLDGFFLDFFGRKAIWPSVATIKSIAASLKKFYKFLAEKNLIDAKDYRYFAAEIKDSIKYWIYSYNEWENYLLGNDLFLS